MLCAIDGFRKKRVDGFRERKIQLTLFGKVVEKVQALTVLRGPVFLHDECSTIIIFIP